jgi:hypothetical protein
MNQVIERHAQCHTILPDGQRLTVAAVARELDGFDPLKVIGSERRVVQEAVLAARMAETSWSNEVRVTLEGLSSAVPEHGAWLALPAILADLSVRARLPGAPQSILALGLCDDWLQGNLKPPATNDFHASLRHLAQCPALGATEMFLPVAADNQTAALYQAIRNAHPACTQHEIANLASLSGQPAAGSLVRTVRVWFPLVAYQAEAASLQELELILRPLGTATEAEKDRIDILGLPGMPLAQRQSMERLLRGLRHKDRHGSGEWQTLLRLPKVAFVGDSWQLALALADRIARGREFAGTGMLMATGQIGFTPNGEPSGQVLHVDGIPDKCAVMLAQVQAGARILLPESWRGQVGRAWLQQVVDKGGSVAFVGKIA